MKTTIDTLLTIDCVNKYAQVYHEDFPINEDGSIDYDKVSFLITQEIVALADQLCVIGHYNEKKVISVIEETFRKRRDETV